MTVLTLTCGCNHNPLLLYLALLHLCTKHRNEGVRTGKMNDLPFAYRQLPLKTAQSHRVLHPSGRSSHLLCLQTPLLLGCDHTAGTLAVPAVLWHRLTVPAPQRSPLHDHRSQGIFFKGKEVEEKGDVLTKAHSLTIILPLETKFDTQGNHRLEDVPVRFLWT